MHRHNDGMRKSIFHWIIIPGNDVIFFPVLQVGTILSMLGHQLDDKMLKEIIDEVDEDGSGELEFEEFTQLAARFLVEEDAEAMQQELKEAFRLYVALDIKLQL